jgi:hypothetical protein
MDANALRAAIEKSRRFSHEIDGRTFDLVLPTQFAIDCLASDFKAPTRFVRKLVLTALRGWSAVRTSDLKAGADIPDEPLPFDETNAEILFNERPDWQNKIADDIAARSAKRVADLEAARGN